MSSFSCHPSFPLPLVHEKVPSLKVTGDIILGTFGFDAGRMVRDTAALALLCCAYLAITDTFALLKYRRSAQGGRKHAQVHTGCQSALSGDHSSQSCFTAWCSGPACLCGTRQSVPRGFGAS